MKRLGILAIALLILFGASLRLINLDGKLYWHDEAYTSLRISGYTQAEVYEQIFTGELLPIAALDRYQHPNLEKTWIDTVKTLAIDDPQHPPLYYLLARWWVEAFGGVRSPAIVRSFSALSGLLVLPAVYWLAQELFVQIESDRQYLGSMGRSRVQPQIRHTAVWLSVALVAVSPYHLLYAQEAREYALWTLLVAVSGALLLRSLRLNSRASWIAYSLTLILGLYTYLLMLLVAIAHGLYVLLRERRWTRNTAALSGAIALSMLAFAPWLWRVVSTWSSTGATWTATGGDRLTLLKLWGLSLARAFVLTRGNFGFDSAIVYFSLPPLLLLTGLALWTCRHTSIATWGFLLTLFAATFLPLALPDWLIGGQRSAASRYLVPCYLAVQLAVAYLLARWSRSAWGRSIVAIVLVVSAIACVQATQADTAWNKVISYNNRPLAAIVNQAPRPLLVTSSFAINFGNLFALSYLLDRDVHLQLIADTTANPNAPIPTIDPSFDSVFLLNLTDRQRAAIEQRQTTSQQLFQDFHLSLWQLR